MIETKTKQSVTQQKSNWKPWQIVLVILLGICALPVVVPDRLGLLAAVVGIAVALGACVLGLLACSAACGIGMILVLAALLLGGVYGGLSGAIGMGIADIMDPVYITGAPKTFVLKFCIGLIVGLVAKKWKFGIVPAVITGIALSFICPAIGTPIGIYVYGGLNGSVSDMLVMSLVQGGKTIFQASFIRNVASNLID